MQLIKNLTNSPLDLMGANGVVRIPAFGEVTAVLNGEYLEVLRHSCAVSVTDVQKPVHEVVVENKPKQEPEATESTGTDLQAEYLARAGKAADKRWSDARLAEEVAKLKE